MTWLERGRSVRRYGKDNPMYGKGLHGEANGNFGKRGAYWVNNGTDNRLMQPKESIPKGFVKGRIVDWSKSNLKYKKDQQHV